jgi:hypothetical protein
MGLFLFRAGKRRRAALTAAPPPPDPGLPTVLSVSNTTRTLYATTGVPVASGYPITVYNSGGGTLTGVAVTIISGGSWITPSLTGAGNTYSLDFTNSVHSNAVGSAVIVLRVSCTNVGVASQDITITGVTSAASVSNTIAVELHRRDGITSSSRLYGNVPLPPGYLFQADVDAGKVQLKISSVEQAIYCESTRGKHIDGSLRSIHIQVNYAHSGTAVAAQVVLGTTRTTTDLTRDSTNEAALYYDAGSGVKRLRTAILPTDVDYLCSTRITFTPLLPRYQETAYEQAWTDLLKTWVNIVRSAEVMAGNSQSSYDHCLALLAYWCKTGDTVEYFEAMDRARWYLDYSVGSTTATDTNPNINVYGDAAYTGAAPLPAEWHSMRYGNYCAAYLLTSHATFYAAVNRRTQAYDKSTRAFAIASAGQNGYISQSGFPRFNLQSFDGLLQGYMLEANRKISSSSYGNRFRDFANEYIWAYDAIEARQQVRQGHMNGITGHGSNIPADAGQIGSQPGDGVHFQTGYFNFFLLRSLDEGLDDSRVDAWIKKNMNLYLENIVTGSTSGYRVQYRYNDLQGPETDATLYGGDYRGGVSYYLPFIATSLAYASNVWPADVVNGKTYAQWYAEVLKTSTMSALTPSAGTANAWKNIGDYWAHTMNASYYAHGGMPRRPTTMRTVPNHTTWPP